MVGALRFALLCAITAVATMAILSVPVVEALTLHQVRLVDWSATRPVHEDGSDLNNTTEDHHQQQHQRSTGNFLFRGDVPVTPFPPPGSYTKSFNVSFDYSTLTELMRVRGAGGRARGKLLAPPFPPSSEDLFILDICLLNLEANQNIDSVKAEQRFFEQNPHLGQFVLWTIHGTPYNASTMDAAQRLPFLKNMSTLGTDNVHDLMLFIRSVLKTGNSLPVSSSTGKTIWFNSQDAAGKTIAIYVHCIGGKDRTGEIIGSYMMQFMSTPPAADGSNPKRYPTARSAYQEDTQIAMRNPHNPNTRMMQWYCYWLVEMGMGSIDYSGLDCADMSNGVVYIG